MKDKIFNIVEDYLKNKEIVFSRTDKNTITILFNEPDKTLIKVIINSQNNFLISLAIMRLPDKFTKNINKLCNDFNISSVSKLFNVKENNKYYLNSEVTYSIDVFKGEHLEEWLNESFGIHTAAMEKFKS